MHFFVKYPFRISQSPTVTNGKWTFTIEPENLAALAGQNFKIVDCTASTPSIATGTAVTGPLTDTLISGR